MNNAKRKASIRFKKIKALKTKRRIEAISRFIDNTSKEMKITIAKKILGLQSYETIDDHPVFGLKPIYSLKARMPSAYDFEHNYRSPFKKDI